jgi:sulfhydrogenase subunit delta
VSGSVSRPTLAVYKFASCDGCQLSLLDLEDELLPLTELVQLADFKEATSSELPGPYDVVLVEGSITTAHDRERLHDVRRNARFLITIGACATAGGIQALRNYRDTGELARYVYAHPEYLSMLDTSTPIAAHVPVDFELRGCPVNKQQLLDVILSLLHGRKPITPAHSVCLDCKLKGNPCVLVTGTPCLGPVTHAGCDALCPTFHRGCFGCYGPQESSNLIAMSDVLRKRGATDADLVRLYRTFNAEAPAFAEAAKRHEGNS